MIETPRVVCCHITVFLWGVINLSTASWTLQLRDSSVLSLLSFVHRLVLCLKHALRISCRKVKFRAHCSLFMRLCIYARILLWKFSHSRLAGAGADCLILSHRWPLTSPVSLSRSRQTPAPPSWTVENHACVLPQSRAAPRALGTLFSMFASSVWIFKIKRIWLSF